MAGIRPQELSDAGAKRTRSRLARPAVRALAILLLAATSGWAQSDDAPAPLDGTPAPPSPSSEPSAAPDETPAPLWGSGESPYGFNAYFATADGCASCHAAADEALALRDRTGRDVSPFALWQPSAHANSNRDPFYLAQLSWSRPPDPGAHEDFEAGCVRCHAPMIAHTARLDGHATPGATVSLAHPLGRDGVSCTVCHQARTEKWTDEHFDGRLPIPGDRVIVGTHPNSVSAPMAEYTGYDLQPNASVKSPELCGSCHTYRNSAGLLISSSYLEWRASRASGGPTCQEC
ncbi:MAG: hypothetical protein AAF488_19235, partial [Planctomycetota bacterium]